MNKLRWIMIWVSHFLRIVWRYDNDPVRHSIKDAARIAKIVADTCIRVIGK
jgi:hypothetical protein